MNNLRYESSEIAFKKLTACILVLLLIAACCLPAFAADDPQQIADRYVIVATPDEATPDEATPDEVLPCDLDKIFDKSTPDEATPDEATPDEEGVIRLYDKAIRITLIDGTSGASVSRYFTGDSRKDAAVKWIRECGGDVKLLHYTGTETVLAEVIYPDDDPDDEDEDLDDEDEDLDDEDDDIDDEDDNTATPDEATPDEEEPEEPEDPDDEGEEDPPSGPVIYRYLIADCYELIVKELNIRILPNDMDIVLEKDIADRPIKGLTGGKGGRKGIASGGLLSRPDPTPSESRRSSVGKQDAAVSAGKNRAVATGDTRKMLFGIFSALPALGAAAYLCRRRSR